MTTTSTDTTTETTPDIFETRESAVRGYSRSWPATFARAQGPKQWDEDGKEYLDFFSGAGALNYGHNNPAVMTPLVEYLQSGAVLHSLDMKTPAKREFLETFEELILKPRGLDYTVMFPGPTGTNTVEAALKLARKVTGRQHLLSFTNAFHGMTLGSLSVTGNSMKREGAGIPLTNSSKIPYEDYLDGETPDFLWLERVLEDSGSGVDKPAAIIVETVQGEGGVRAARAEWLRELSALCKKHDILLIVDDVQAGCGRTGTFFSFEDAGIEPDIVCLSKSISGSGLPMALTLFRPELDAWEPGEHNGTFRGNNPAFVTATAALKTFWADNGFQNRLADTIAHLHQRLDQIAEKAEGATVRGRGMLAGLLFDDPEVAGQVAADAFAGGLLIETSGPRDEVVKIMPPLTISEADLTAGLDILEASVLKVAPAGAEAAPAMA
ncbi:MULTISPECIES: diaminobutyrate--2-oxoglutarate transaminase [Brevibacterium]|uniref:Diaminobutyrate--2-oxoglutarate transaminase n=2 Tax=Brevibacterium casei TaxID=33889 RepID=K9AYE1_9MICO|nr:diaminobutyrate--2-oxoglutarate transaminase [Brevibacterium casei]NJE67797.1 diaminobutyrate--2-oxoglutarate transaminase [Brevibacterium sp. LS14]EKU47582.1 diaminobutyrate--2-oxoglutarate aminotransferase [Brevibacterium casei S18]KZE17063.1 diaminobutyrate--2-oxoglutarate transaminase [Brevibacterium casei]MBE4694749.1 diaminobutyrate--2-oxoglutarate transaminase [Brevibacterium casei]MBY3577871.1 diaminobutyrate--2-oxoglutarate transaminase [Brevibacterium casei]